jgi:hypothetical protein
MGKINTYILGGGITGLVWKFYNPDYQIISPDIGGVFAKTHMVWLHDTMETRKLLTDIGFRNPERLTMKSYIGYFTNGWVSDIQTEDLNRRIILRKMTAWNEKIDKTWDPPTRDLSTVNIVGNNYMNTLDVDLEEVILRISDKSDIMNGRVVNIDKSNIIIENKDGLSSAPYESLVSTIPAPFFWSAYGDISKEFKSIPITNIIVSKCPPFFDEDYSMIYYTEEFPFSRVSNIRGKYCIEFTGIITQEEFKNLYPDLHVEEYFVVKHGRLFNCPGNNPPAENIIFSGRFGKWEYGITTEIVVKQVYDYKFKNKKNENQSSKESIVSSERESSIFV